MPRSNKGVGWGGGEGIVGILQVGKHWPGQDMVMEMGTRRFM